MTRVWPTVRGPQRTVPDPSLLTFGGGAAYHDLSSDEIEDTVVPGKVISEVSTIIVVGEGIFPVLDA